MAKTNRAGYQRVFLAALHSLYRAEIEITSGWSERERTAQKEEKDLCGDTARLDGGHFTVASHET